ncbi:MAG: UvrD-helicase domain-containing protein [Erysipelotrichaceae bacterium]|nr:UvrD-helicase domain-containing protein [Erysipelotrichaceae bacterium]
MNNKKWNTADEIARDDILNKINTNLFVEAGAGSGKTTMLVNRMVSMVENGIPVDKICAITFTKNAALEFYDRFQEMLSERADPDNHKGAKHAGDLDVPTDLSRSRCAKALEDIDLCFMGTIDSFCNMILSEHPSEARIPSDAKLISADEAKEIYSQFYLECRKGKHGSDIKKYAQRFEMLFWNSEEMFGKLMYEIMDRRNVKFNFDDRYCVEFKTVFPKELQNEVRRVLDAFNNDLGKLTVKLGKTDKRDPIGEAYASANDILHKEWRYNYTGVYKALKDIKDLEYAATNDELGFTTESIVRDKAGKTVLNIADKDNPEALLPKLNNYKYQNTLRFLLLCVKPLEEKLKQDGLFTFFDYLYYLRNVLEEDAHKGGKLIDYIYNRHSYFMIDEFQDTNPMQAEIFFYLSAADPNQKSWMDCKPRPGSLFIVGDPKQSIYRFRGADVASYLKVKHLFEDASVGEVKKLVNNFRSKDKVKTYFNDVFNMTMPEETDEQSRYVDIENIGTDKDSDELKGIYTYESYSEKLLSDYPDMDDNLRIIEIIKRLTGNKNLYLTDKEGNKRTVSYGDFMVIFSGKKPIARCIEAFEKEKIPARVEGKVLFEKCEGLRTIANIYKTVTDPADQVSLVSTLKSDVFGFNDNDLAAYVKEGKRLRIEKRDCINSGMDKAMKDLYDLSESTAVLTPTSLYEKIMDKLEIFRYVSADRMEIVYYTLELIRGRETEGSVVTYADAVNYLDELLSGNSDLERCLSLSQKSDAVHIANLHKVKGLEAPIVILAKSGANNSTPSIRIEYKDSGADAYICSIGEKNEDTGITITHIETDEWSDKKDKEKISKQSEDKRLVYVAATRARNVLIVNIPKKPGRNGKPEGMGNTWKPLVENADGDFFETYKENPDYQMPDYPDEDPEELYNVGTTEISNKETYSFRQPSDIKAEDKTNEDSCGSDNVSLSDGESYATLIGTMVHRMMELIIMSKDRIEKDDAVDNIISDYVRPEFDQYRTEFISTLNKVYETMHNGGYDQKGKAVKDILPVLMEADKIYSEVPFTYKSEEELWNGIIDLIYEKDGMLHIIDWKTNRNDEGLDEHYHDQLEAYKQAVKKLTGKDVEDAMIYHIDIRV